MMSETLSYVSCVLSYMICQKILFGFHLYATHGGSPVFTTQVKLQKLIHVYKWSNLSGNQNL